MEPLKEYSQRPPYQKCGHTPSNRDEDKRWFMVYVKVYGKALAISICAEEFDNSPTRLDEFTQYLDLLQLDTEGEWLSEEEHDVHEGVESPTQRLTLDLSLDGCYEWAVRPFFPLLEGITSRPSDAEKITLQHFFTSESFDASLTAADDSLILGVIEA